MERYLGMLFPGNESAGWFTDLSKAQDLWEIRLRIGQPVLVRKGSGECYLDERGRPTDSLQKACRTQQTQLERFVLQLCQDSPYAFEETLRQGFFTVEGGHRIGVAGQVVMEEDGRIRTMKHISSVNIRIARQVPGAAEEILPCLYRQGLVCNTLIVSPPACGKTTLLRELIRRISDGNAWGKGVQVGVVDERSELAGSYLGRAQNDLGCRTDVLDGCPKTVGMMMLLRSMAPQVLAVDEIGSPGDVEAIRQAGVCGCRVIATAHGDGLQDVRARFRGVYESFFFDLIILLENRDGQPRVRGLFHCVRGEDGKGEAGYARVGIGAGL